MQRHDCPSHTIMLLAFVKSNASTCFYEIKIIKSSRHMSRLKLATYSRKNPGFTVIEYTKSTEECKASIFHNTTADDMCHFRCDVRFEKGFGSLRQIPEPTERNPFSWITGYTRLQDSSYVCILTTLTLSNFNHMDFGYLEIIKAL